MNRDRDTAARLSLAPRRLLPWLAAALAVGGAATWLWFGALPPESRHPPAVLLRALGLVVAATIGNVGIRWIRWRYLCRKTGIRSGARESLLVFLATLPAVLSPFYLGELARIPMLGPWSRGWRPLARVFLAERGADAIALLSLVAVSRWGLEAAVWIGSLCWLVCLAFASLRRRGWAVSLPLSWAAWGLPAVSLAAVSGAFGWPVSPWRAAGIFGRATLLGGLTGIPAGAGVSGSILRWGLLRTGLAESDVSWITAVFRGGTTWLAVAVGILALAFWTLSRRTERAVQHFDDIAEVYDEQIPAYLREHLLRRKVDFMMRRLPGEAGLRGLDVGCGQGWYACECTRRGARMAGIDSSQGQVEHASARAREQGVAVDFRVAGVSDIPFGPGSMDFVYVINVLHHLAGVGDQHRALSEMARRLKPGGRLFVHEINPRNPLFRFYMGYIFPLMNSIDEGTEHWLDPRSFPPLDGGVWRRPLYFTFLPDLLPRWLWRLLQPIEHRLERSPARAWSAHYMMEWVRDAG